jgi:hypothetical protein
MGITTTNLYRMGNAGGPKMDDVRIRQPYPDIETFTDVSGNVWVKARTGGVSPSETLSTTLRGKAWLIPSQTQYSDRLRVWNDDPAVGHWLWEPVNDMLLTDFQVDLAAINLVAQPV